MRTEAGGTVRRIEEQDLDHVSGGAPEVLSLECRFRQADVMTAAGHWDSNGFYVVKCSAVCDNCACYGTNRCSDGYHRIVKHSIPKTGMLWPDDFLNHHEKRVTHLTIWD